MKMLHHQDVAARSRAKGNGCDFSDAESGWNSSRGGKKVGNSLPGACFQLSISSHVQISPSLHEHRTPIGVPCSWKTYMSRRWIAELVLPTAGKESRREPLFLLHHESDDHIAGAERIHCRRVFFSSDQFLPLVFIAAGRKAGCSEFRHIRVEFFLSAGSVPDLELLKARAFIIIPLEIIFIFRKIREKRMLGHGLVPRCFENIPVSASLVLLTTPDAAHRQCGGKNKNEFLHCNKSLSLTEKHPASVRCRRIKIQTIFRGGKFRGDVFSLRTGNFSTRTKEPFLIAAGKCLQFLPHKQTGGEQEERIRLCKKRSTYKSEKTVEISIKTVDTPGCV